MRTSFLLPPLSSRQSVRYKLSLLCNCWCNAFCIASPLAQWGLRKLLSMDQRCKNVMWGLKDCRVNVAALLQWPVGGIPFYVSWPCRGRTTFRHINPYPTAFPYGNGMVLHFYQQQESSTTKTVHKVINKGLKTYV